MKYCGKLLLGHTSHRW